MSSPWFAVILAFFACNTHSNKEPPQQPAKRSSVTTTPPPAADRRHDPAFALKAINGKYIGRVAEMCPWGPVTQDSTQVLPPIKSSDYKLVGDKLEIKLPYGGCPLWTGYTVVTGSGSPLPFYVCHEIQHDTCEMAGDKTWVFDVSKQLKANHATAMAFGVPAGVH